MSGSRSRWLRAAALATAFWSTTVTAPAVSSAEVGSDTLRQGESLTDASPQQLLRSRNGQHVLRWFSDGIEEFVGQHFGATMLATFSRDQVNPGVHRLVLQRDGNLVGYAPDGRVLFATATFTDETVRLVLRDDGNLVLSTATGRVLWASGAVPTQMVAEVPNSVLDGPTVLRPGHFLLSPNRRYRLIMQADGNLVLYERGGRATFATATFGGPDSTFAAQPDGNLVVYDGSRAVWASHTAGRPQPVDFYSARLQNDGNFVQYFIPDLFSAERPVWSSRYGNG